MGQAQQLLLVVWIVECVVPGNSGYLTPCQAWLLTAGHALTQSLSI
jgi:hypothetical protein